MRNGPANPAERPGETRVLARARPRAVEPRLDTAERRVRADDRPLERRQRRVPDLERHAAAGTVREQRTAQLEVTWTRDRVRLDTVRSAAERELERRALTAERAALAVKGVTKSGGASAGGGVSGMVLVTTDGFHGAYLASRQGISMTAIAGEGTGMERDYDYTSALHASDLATPESVGRKAAERAVARANPRKVETCKVPVVYDPRVAGSLIGHLVGAVNGTSVARKTSFLKDKLGQKLFADSIRIVDDPLRVRGLRSQTFDAEGVKVKKLAIIDQGVLTSWLLDCATARELGMTTTGHAHRGVSSSPSPGAYNLHLEAGSASPKELISDISQGFYVTDLIGSGVNNVTGDYSRGASGFWIENGEITYPVSEVTLAGHLFDIFRSLTPANDLEFRYGINAPTLRIEGLTLGGR